jgi:hypothetical protein
MTTEGRLLDILHPHVRYKRVQVPETENAMSFFRRAVQHISNIGDIEKLKKETDVCSCSRESAACPSSQQALIAARLSQVDAVLVANRTTLELTNSGICCPRSQVPQLMGPKDIGRDMQVLGSLCNLFRLRSWQAHALAARGDYAAAAEQLVGTLRMANMICHGDGYVLHYMSGSVTRSAVLKDMVDIVKTCQPPAEPRSVLLAGVRRCMAEPDGLADAWRVELCVWALHHVEQLAKADSLEQLAERYQRIYFGEPSPQDPTSGDAGRVTEEHRNELEQRFRYLLFRHPDPFDVRRTIRMLSDKALDQVLDIERPRWLRSVAAPVIATCWLLRYRLGRYERQRRAWPALFVPGLPITVADDEEARSSRSIVKDVLVPKSFDLLWPEVESDWVRVRHRLARIRNPVGLLFLDEAVFSGASMRARTRRDLLDAERQLNAT